MCGLVGTPVVPDDALLTDGVARWLATHLEVDRVIVDEVEHPSVGYSSVTSLLRARWTAEEPVVQRLVVRMAPASPGTIPDYDLVAQHAAQTAAAAAGVPIATPIATETDPSWLGAPFMVMPRVDGPIIGEAPPFDRWLGALDVTEQRTLHDTFLATVARIHEASIDGPIQGGVPVRDDGAEFDYWDEYLRWSSGGVPVPALVDGLDWCRARRPAHASAPVLRWGDVRLGNVVFGEDLRPLAVLDWDMTAVGAPEHDLAWFTMLDAATTTLSGRRVEGFPHRDATADQYQGLTGRELVDLEWYETFALVRSTAIMSRIGFLDREAGRDPVLPPDDNPLLDLLCERTRR